MGLSFTHPSQRDLALFGVYMVVVIDMMSSALTVPVMPLKATGAPYRRASICACD